MTRLSSSRRKFVEIVAHRVGRPGAARHFDAAADERVLRQHRELDLPRDLQVVLQRQPVGHLQEHQQVDQREAAEQPEGALGPDRTSDPDIEEERNQRHAHRG